MKKMPSIESLKHAAKRINLTADHHKQPYPTLTFLGSTKLHGTNAGIRRNKSKSGEVSFIAQSKKQVQGPGNHYGFPEFVMALPQEKLNALFDAAFGPDEPKATLFGEWIGPGVQSKVAITQLPEKQFVLFLGATGDGEDAVYVDVRNKELQLPEHRVFNIADVGLYEVEVDFAKWQESLPELERMTLEIEAKCPWGQKFGIEGVGEGIVWIPTDPKYFQDTGTWFKTKGDDHKTSKQVAHVNPKDRKLMDEVVDRIVTERRLEQGIEHLMEMQLEISMRSIGEFLGFVGRDLQREEGPEVEELGLSWKKVWKLGSVKAKKWFVQRIKESDD